MYADINRNTSSQKPEGKAAISRTDSNV